MQAFSNIKNNAHHRFKQLWSDVGQVDVEVGPKGFKFCQASVISYNKTDIMLILPKKNETKKKFTTHSPSLPSHSLRNNREFSKMINELIGEEPILNQVK